MIDLTIHDLDEDVIETLEIRAARHGHSLEAETRTVLVAAARTPTPEEVRARAKQIAAMAPPDPQTDSVTLLHEDRSRDDGEA